MISMTTAAPKIINEKIDLEVIKTIFHWHLTYEPKYYDPSPECHCLLRIYSINRGCEAVAIASDVYSSDKNIDLYRGYPDLVKAAIATFPELKPAGNQITWIA